eukprot:m.59499 g.59499  ORF g.59499 m.59499 type:complete len:482 (+) comp7911_c0_seq4:169-1614(+)
MFLSTSFARRILLGVIGGVGVTGGLDSLSQPSFTKVEENNDFAIFKNTVLCEEEGEQHRNGCEWNYDIGIIGGGIVGVACARELKHRFPKKKIILIEKDDDVGNQQSGHNSGVIHCGIYYGRGSLRAQLCTKGNKLMYDFCKQRGIKHEQCGKLIVAVKERELEPLRKLYENGLGNNVEGLTWLEGCESIQTYEPNCVGLAAIHCNTTGIVDYKQVTKAMLHDFLVLGGEIAVATTVVGLDDVVQPGNPKNFENGVRIITKERGSYVCNHVITCGGAYSDKLAKMSGCSETPKIIPVRGEYLKLKHDKRGLVNGNIYPVPDARVPFLGVHFTPRVSGDVLLGPNAVLAFAREGYSYSDINWKELYECVSYIGFIKLAVKYWDFGAKELWHSINTAAQVKRLQMYIPSLEFQDVEQGPAGVRAMALGDDGEMVKDFLFDSGEGEARKRILHVRNAPSPAATSSLSIASHIADVAQAQFEFNY